MAIELRSAGGLRVIAMPDGNVLQANSGIEFAHGLFVAFFGNNVIPGDVHVARVNASSHGNVISQMLDDFGDLLEAAAQRVLGAGAVFDQDCESALRQVEIIAGGSDCGGGLQQSLVSIGATK